MTAGRANNPSYGWRSVVAARQVLHRGLRKTIGNGHDTKVWEEPWLPSHPARPPTNVGPFRDENLRVHHLIDTEQQEWNFDLLSELVIAEDIPHITSLRVSRTADTIVTAGTTLSLDYMIRPKSGRITLAGCWI